MDHINEALEIITGSKSLGYYIAGFFFSFLAIIISLYQHSKSRNPYSSKTPYKFSWRFLLWDNCKRAAVTMIVMFILFRVFDLTTPVLMIGVGFLVSFALDRIILALMKWSEPICKMLGMDRDSSPVKPFKGNEGN